MKSDHTNPKNNSIVETRQYQDDTEPNKSIRRSGSHSIAGPLSVLLAMVGSGLQGYANGTVDALFVVVLLLIAGFVAVSLLFPRGRAERRAFLLTYGVCVFAGGLAQCYSLAVFDNPQSTIDAVNSFLPNIKSQPPFTTMAAWPILIESTLPIVIWQQVYKLTWLLGLDYGPYIGVMFNAVVMGITASLTVRTARELYRDDAWRLRRVGTLFAFCGLFILFGAVLIRDCFTIFLNVLVLWGIVHWLVRSTPINLLFAIVLTGVSAYAMAFLRIEAVVLFGPFWLLAFLFWYFKQRLNITRLFAMTLAICILLVASGYIVEYAHSLQETQTGGMTQYNELSVDADTGNSLGMRLVINQPLPIRLVVGSGSMMVFPVPLWAYFKIGENDYHLIKGYHGIYQVLVLPLFFAGLIIAIGTFFKRRQQLTPMLFLTVYTIMNLLAVVATSLEQRHFAQFMPAVMILATLPDTRNRKVRTKVQSIAGLWFLVVILLHVAWAIMKG